ncbi:MAG: hypothetical protein JWN48_4655 [Myxococcaceae bacterium]|nr:hypothetical protein [Myxococcaceae bacterium]
MRQADERLPRRDPTSLGGALDSSTESALDSEAREEMRAFLQQRVSSFGRLLAGMFGIFFVWRVLSTLFDDDSPSGAYLPWQAISLSSFAAIWLLCRSKPRSMRFIRLTELLGLCGAGTGAVLMALHMSYMARPDSVLLLCLSYTLITRSIMVPSSARRTLVYGATFALPFLLSVFFLHRLHHDPAIYTPAADPRLRDDAVTIARRWTVVAALWWTATLLLTTATSRVIYGLRKQVRDARRLGQYTLTEKLGQGGMGVVYLARHALLRRPSAIKLLQPARLGAESVARFEREVQLTASLSHPNTIRVFDYGRTPDGIFYYVMEYLEGAGLDDVVAHTGPLPAARVIHILDQVAGALSEAHGIGLIHRDIKPANIILTQQGGVPDVAKVLDFGLVKQLKRASGDEPTLQAVTRDEDISGTPLYMAPEAIISPERIDGRTDLYSLGAVGYFLLTGFDVFGGRNVLEICGHHLHSEPLPPSQRVSFPIAADLEALILACLEKQPARRPADAGALQLALRACQDARRWDEAEARAWFSAHRAALRERQARTVVSGEATVAVDLGVRFQESPADATESVA